MVPATGEKVCNPGAASAGVSQWGAVNARAEWAFAGFTSGIPVTGL